MFISNKHKIEKAHHLTTHNNIDYLQKSSSNLDNRSTPTKQSTALHENAWVQIRIASETLMSLPPQEHDIG